MGSEMCIRDRRCSVFSALPKRPSHKTFSPYQTFSQNNRHGSHNYWLADFWPFFWQQGKTRTRIHIYEYQPVGKARPSDPNLTENSWTEEEFEGEEALSPQRMPCMLTMAHTVVRTTSGAGPSTIKDEEDDKPVASRTRGRTRAGEAKKE